jgi:excisionase family DNA binding protein
MSHNPFDLIEARLSNIENLLLDIKHPKLEHSPSPDYITRKEAADVLGISLHTLNAWIKEGKVPAFRIGSRVRFKRSDVESSLKKIKVA